MPELIDVRDIQGNLTGEAMMRREAHMAEVWHGVAVIWVYNSKGDILLQRRAAHLNAFPEKWDVSVAGHISAGDKPLPTAVRELREELGIHANTSELQPVGMIAETFPLVYGKVHHECSYLFLLHHDIEIASLRLQVAEVMEARWISADELEHDLADPAATKDYSTRDPEIYKLAIAAARRQLAVAKTTLM